MHNNNTLNNSQLQEQLSHWLSNKLAKLCSIDPSEIEQDQPLSTYGLDSMNALSITGELEEMIGIELPSTMFWDFPSIKKVTEFIQGKIIQENNM